MDNEKIFIEKNVRFIIQQQIGSKIFSQLEKKYKLRIFRGNGKILVLVEEKENSD